MFRGNIFCVSRAVSSATVAELTQHGGNVVYEVRPNTVVTAVIIASKPQRGDETDDQRPWRKGFGWLETNLFPPSLEDVVRSRRIPVLYENWVHACRREGRLRLPFGDCPDLVAYNPFLFAGIRFTTTQLPLRLKANMVALLQFYGATYHRHLLDTTNLLLYSHAAGRHAEQAGASLPGTAASQAALHSSSPTGSRCDDELLRKPVGDGTEDGMQVAHRARSPTVLSEGDTPAATPRQTKLFVARQRGIPCTTPQWVQLSLNDGKLQPWQICATSATTGRVNACDAAFSAVGETVKDAASLPVPLERPAWDGENVVQAWVNEILTSSPSLLPALEKVRAGTLGEATAFNGKQKAHNSPQRDTHPQSKTAITDDSMHVTRKRRHTC